MQVCPVCGVECVDDLDVCSHMKVFHPVAFNIKTRSYI